ncbi:MAG: hypothetical protein K0R08_1914 [Solimicrobium sp.]|nr:hypothetical protein [Solimicrobium sp.]
MKHQFNIGDHVKWNSEFGHISGKIIKIHTQDVIFKGRTRHANEDEPQYEVQSDKTGHIAIHKESALQKILPNK